jgi:hypothetical protein
MLDLVSGTAPVGGRLAERRTKRPAVALGAPAGQLAAWALLALSNGVLISILAPMPVGRAMVRVPHHVFSALHMIALGLIAYWVVRGAARVLPARLGVRLLALFALAAGIAALTTGEDLSGFLERQATAGSTFPWQPLFVVGTGFAVALTAGLGRLFARRWLRWVAVAGGVTAAVANHFVLAGSYPAFHFFVAWCGATLAGAALATMRVHPRRFTARLATPALVLATLVACAGLAIRPSDTVWREMWWSPTAVLVPALARFRDLVWIDDGRHSLAASPWLRDRAGLPDIPPSQPPLFDRPPHIVFITVDAMRADLLADDKYAKALPALTSLRHQSLDFADAHSPSPSTVTTITSFLTGKYYSQLYWTPFLTGRYKGYAMPQEDPSPRLPELLAPAGVLSAHVIGLFGLSAEAGVATGFTEEIPASRNYPTAREMMDLAIARLRRADIEPVFLYMHMLDPHAPYDRGGTGGTSFENYTAEVGMVDREIGRLVDFLRTEDLEDHTILIVSADHGEAFREHQLVYHATSLYEELLHVPLLLHAPGVMPRRIQEPVSILDLGPTILDLQGLPTPAAFQGESLVPYLRGGDPVFSRPIAADAGRRMQALYFPDGYKAITDLRKGTFEVYNLKKDPQETKNLVDSLGDEGTRYVGALRAFFKHHTLDRPGYTPPWRQF